MIGAAMIGAAMEKPIPYSQLRPMELMKLYNERAVQFGEPPMKRPLALVQMVQRLALMNTRRLPPVQLPPKVKAKVRTAPVRDAMVKALCEVSYYVDSENGEKITPVNVNRHAHRRLTSVGYPYAEICKKLQRQFRKSRMTVEFLMVETSNLRRRARGYEKYECQLPDKRPRPYHRSPHHGNVQARRFSKGRN